jgi:hypothetical protein
MHCNSDYYNTMKKTATRLNDWCTRQPLEARLTRGESQSGREGERRKVEHEGRIAKIC